MATLSPSATSQRSPCCVPTVRRYAQRYRRLSKNPSRVVLEILVDRVLVRG
ncbi:MAG: hypothetical protein ACR2K2_14520 [Mycobacteriales bacterium]